MPSVEVTLVFSDRHTMDAIGGALRAARNYAGGGLTMEMEVGGLGKAFASEIRTRYALPITARRKVAG